MTKLKQLATFLALAFLSVLFVQASPNGVTDGETSGRLRDGLYEYHVPFAESNFVGTWKFRLEIAAADGSPFVATIKGYNIFGEEVSVALEQDFGSGAVFAWDSGSSKLMVLQSLFISSEEPLTGVLWMWNPTSGVMNGVSIQNQLGTRLVMPHVPVDYFSWRTYFSIMGVSQGTSGDISFGFYDDLGAYKELDYWQNLSNRGFLTAVPYLDIPIGGLGQRRAQWAVVRSDFDDYQLAGYQSYNTLNRSNTSCAIEMMGEGESEGWVGFSRLEERDFSSFLSFSNPHNELVLLNFELFHEVDVEVTDEDGLTTVVTEVQSKQVTEEIRPFERRIFSPVGVFGEVDRMVSFRYQATSVPFDDGEGNMTVDPRPVYALHMQFGGAGEMGGHHFVGAPGNRSTAWLNLGDTFKTVVELYNTSDQPHLFNVRLLDEDGAEVFSFEREMPAYGSYHLISSTLLQMLLAIQGDFDLSRPLRLHIESLNLEHRFFSKQTAVQEQDIAIVNPLMIVAQPEPPADDDTSDGSATAVASQTKNGKK